MPAMLDKLKQHVQPALPELDAVDLVEAGIQRAKPYLERARQSDDDPRSVAR